MDLLTIMMYDVVTEVVMRLKKISKVIIGAAGFMVLLNVKQVPMDKARGCIIRTKTLPEAVQENQIIEKVTWIAAIMCALAAVFKKFMSLSVFKKICIISVGLLVASSVLFGFGNTVNACIWGAKAAFSWITSLFSEK